jgi:hypothetical protein
VARIRKQRHERNIGREGGRAAGSADHGVKRPDTFIVGTFKAGTSTMWRELNQHPQVFMSEVKEPMFFGQDLSSRYRRMTEDEYLALFKDAREDQRAGEASPWYLYSTTSAREIREFNPEARIIVMLRNPVDVMYSQHSQLVYNLREDLTDFAEALAAEGDRAAGKRIPADALRPEALLYRRSVRFPEQVSRYLDCFGRERVHFIVFDDLAADAAGVYRSTLNFLGVDAAFEIEHTVENANKASRSRLVQRLVFAPPKPLRSVYGRLRTMPMMHRVRDRIARSNVERVKRQPMDPQLRRQLTAEFAPQVEELGELIGRDLSAWSVAA